MGVAFHGVGIREKGAGTESLLPLTSECCGHGEVPGPLWTPVSLSVIIAPPRKVPVQMKENEGK